MRTVAVISAGEMGSGVARILAGNGHRVVTWLGGRSARTRERAAAAGMQELPELASLLGQAEVLLSIVPPARAVELAEQVGPRPDLLYVDCNAVSPDTVRRVAAIVGEGFVDAGIIGAPASPRFYAAGPRASELAGLGLDLRILDREIGAASGLKMCYAALTKGLTALASEQRLAAERLGLSRELAAELESSQPALQEWAGAAIPGMLPKAHRWIAEMEEIAATFEALGLTPRMLAGAADMYRLIESGSAPVAVPVRADQQATDRRR